VSTVTVYLTTSTGPAPVRLPDDLPVGHLTGPLATKAGLGTVRTRLAHDTVGLLDPDATLVGLGLGAGSVLRVVVDAAPTPPEPQTEPEPAAVAPPGRALVPVTVPVGWLGAHGGAGTTTLAELLGGGDLHTTPHPGTTNTIVVARTNAQGLQAAQRLAAGWSDPAAPRGLVLIADTPGRLPKPLTELRHLVEGAYPHRWHIPWIEQLRRGDPPPPVKALTRLAHDLQTLTTNT